MARKKPYKIDPPTKTVTIPDVPSVIADQFNRLISDRIRRSAIESRKKGGEILTKPQIFKQIVLDERIKDVGEDMVAGTMELYNETQERRRRLNERSIDGQDKDLV